MWRERGKRGGWRRGRGRGRSMSRAWMNQGKKWAEKWGESATRAGETIRQTVLTEVRRMTEGTCPACRREVRDTHSNGHCTGKEHLKEVVRGAKRAMGEGQVEIARRLVKKGFSGELGARTAASLQRYRMS